MNNRTNLYLFLIVSIILPLNLLCSMGGSTEQGNAKISGTLYPCALPETNITVHLVPEFYNPYDTTCGMIYKTLTDINGDFTFENIPYGSYYVYAFDNDSRNTLLKGPFQINIDQNELNSDSLRRSSSVTISTAISNLTKPDFYFIKGTSKIDCIFENSVNKLENVPSGQHDIIQYNQSENVVVPFTEDVGVFPDESITVSFNNRPPRITSPVSKFPSMLQIGTTYTLQLNASDPDSETVFFSVITQGLVNFTLDSLSGFLKWQPDASQQNLKQIIFKVGDNRSAFSTFIWDFELIESVTPAPGVPFGIKECHLDSMYTYSAKETPCSLVPVLYRFLIDDVDSSQWSQDNTLLQKWIVSGTHKVQVQVHCRGFTSPSQWSEPLIINVRKISEIPLMLSSKDTVAYQSLFTPKFEPSCNLIQLHINGIDSPWVDQSAISFVPPAPGVFILQVSQWCDTVNSFPSEKSAPCTVVVIPPEPTLKMDATYKYQDTTMIPVYIYPTFTEAIDMGTIEYHIKIISRENATKNITLGYLKIEKNPCDSLKGQCNDTLVITNEVESAWLQSSTIVIHLFKPSGIYFIEAQCIIDKYKLPSKWSSSTISGN